MKVNVGDRIWLIKQLWLAEQYDYDMKEPILFEVKDFKVNVPITDIDKFIRDVNETNISGIMLSISSGISNKKNFQIVFCCD
jgi:hypothetical protein